MTINLSIKNVPDSLADALRARAEQNHRSLQGELMAILERAVLEQAAQPYATNRGSPYTNAAAASQQKLSIDEVAARARKLFPQGTANSVAFIREMRDGRYGDEWARTGRQAGTD